MIKENGVRAKQSNEAYIPVVQALISINIVLIIL
jgi:hypothetical protein